MPVQRLTAWIAALAMVAAALVPAITQAASAGAGGQGWLEVCTRSGVERITVDGAPGAPGGGEAVGGMACPWCHLPAALPGMPARAFVFSVAYGDERISTPREQHVPRTRVSATPARPRAPPLSA